MVLLQIWEIIFQDNRPPSIQGIFSSGIRPQKSCEVFFFSSKEKRKANIPNTLCLSFTNSLIIRRLKFYFSTVPCVLLHKGMYSRVTKEQILSYFLCTLVFSLGETACNVSAEVFPTSSHTIFPILKNHKVTYCQEFPIPWNT